MMGGRWETAHQAAHCVLCFTAMARWLRGLAAVDLCRRILLEVAKEMLGGCLISALTKQRCQKWCWFSSSTVLTPPNVPAIFATHT